MKKIGLVILAAGASKRLGYPKQLIQFRGKYLLQHIIDEAENAKVIFRLLILGANLETIKEQIDPVSFNVAINPNWQEGMASSLRIAVENAESENLDGLLVILSDQPYVDTELLNELIELYEPEKNMIVASEYNKILGVPALFDRHYFRELMKLKGDTGARKLISTFREKIKQVKFDSGELDIDTPSDMEKLRKEEGENNY